MPAFSFTAPQITPEEEQRERDNLTKDMKEEVEQDLFGVETETIETEEMIETQLELFHEALDQIPESEKKEYLMAKERAPKLFERDCDPVKFLRCEKYNPWVRMSCIRRSMRSLVTAVVSHLLVNSLVRLFLIAGGCKSHGCVLEDTLQPFWRRTCVSTHDFCKLFE